MAIVAKWLTHRFVDPTLEGSIPFDRPFLCEPLAQLVEHLTFNQGVVGSSPTWLMFFFLIFIPHHVIVSFA